MIKTFLSIYNILSPKQKIFLITLTVFSFFYAIFGVASYMSIPYYMQTSFNIEKIFFGRFFINKLGYSASGAFFFFSLGFLVFHLFRFFFSIFERYISLRVMSSISRMMANRVFFSMMSFSYQKFVMQSKDEYKNFSLLVNKVNNYLELVNIIISDVLLALSFYVYLLFVDTIVTLFITFILLLYLYSSQIILKNRMRTSGSKLLQGQMNFSRLSENVFSNFKFFKLRGDYDRTLQTYNSSKNYIEKLQIKTTIMSRINFFLVEYITVVLMVGIVSYYYLLGPVENSFSILVTYAISFYRMMPSFNRIMDSYHRLSVEGEVIVQKLDFILHEEKEVLLFEPHYDLPFTRQIDVKNLSFEYLPNKMIIKNASFSIKKGDKIAFIGATGSGKTTLIDLLIGLLYPLSGEIVVDGRVLKQENLALWRQKIAYIPQNIFLFEGTLAENVAFGSPIDNSRLKNALTRAQIWDFFEKEAKGLNTPIGYDGENLSGGQKQRVGIARAFYQEASIFVLDEATSALDEKTERYVMQEIYENSKEQTLFVIAHRLSTIQLCDRFFYLENGHLEERKSS